MVVQRQRQKLLAELGPSQAKQKLLEMWAVLNPDQDSFDSVSKSFAKEHSITLLELCETWHKLRSQNDTVGIMVNSFAHTVAEKNKQINSMGETIHQQRKRLEQFQKQANTPSVVPE